MTTKEVIEVLRNDVSKDLELYETEDGAMFGGVGGMDMFDIDNGKIIFHCQCSRKLKRTSIDYFKSSKEEIIKFMKEFI